VAALIGLILVPAAAIAWIVHGPLIGGLPLVGAVGAMVLLRQFHPRRTVRAAA
jgi:hypothetical protein